MTQFQWMEVALLAGLGTYLLRAAPFIIASRYEISGAVKDFLAYTSLAIIAGIVSKTLIFHRPGEGMAESFIKLASLALAAGLFKWRGNVPLSLISAIIMAVILKAGL